MAAASAPSAPLRVVIIGAGVAGLSAASCLKDAKFWKSKGHFNEAPEVEVVVLEARDRLGGRICTEHFADGTAVDLGAAWLHGNSMSNPLLRLSKLCGAELVETDWDNALVFEAVGSEKEPEVKMEKISDEKLKKVEHIFSTLMKLYKTKQHADRKAATGESKDRSLMATLQELKSKKFKGIDSLDERTRLLLLSELDVVTEHDYAATPGELSSTWWDEDEEFPGGHSLWKHGFASLIEYLSHGINVILNARVVRISRCETKVSIQLENGHCHEADHCICTIPLGVLKRDHPILFDPALPESKLRSISRLGVGTMEKVALRFQDCFWEQGSPHSPPEALHCIYRKPTTEGRRQPGAMEAPYFVSLKPVTSSNTLVAYYVTDGARELASLEAAERVRHTLQLLCTMFGPLEPTSLEEKLLEAKCTSWTLDEQSLGAYSFNATGHEASWLGLKHRPKGPTNLVPAPIAQ